LRYEWKRLPSLPYQINHLWQFTQGFVFLLVWKKSPGKAHDIFQRFTKSLENKSFTRFVDFLKKRSKPRGAKIERVEAAQGPTRWHAQVRIWSEYLIFFEDIRKLDLSDWASGGIGIFYPKRRTATGTLCGFLPRQSGTRTEELTSPYHFHLRAGQDFDVVGKKVFTYVLSGRELPIITGSDTSDFHAYPIIEFAIRNVDGYPKNIYSYTPFGARRSLLFCCQSSPKREGLIMNRFRRFAKSYFDQTLPALACSVDSKKLSARSGKRNDQKLLWKELRSKSLHAVSLRADVDWGNSDSKRQSKIGK